MRLGLGNLMLRVKLRVAGHNTEIAIPEKKLGKLLAAGLDIGAKVEEALLAKGERGNEATRKKIALIVGMIANRMIARIIAINKNIVERDRVAAAIKIVFAKMRKNIGLTEALKKGLELEKKGVPVNGGVGSREPRNGNGDMGGARVAIRSASVAEKANRAGGVNPAAKGSENLNRREIEGLKRRKDIFSVADKGGEMENLDRGMIRLE